MSTKDLLTLILAFLGFILGVYNACLNYKKERREKEKSEKDKINRETENDMFILKNTLHGYEDFIRTFLAIIEEEINQKTAPKDVYQVTRQIHLTNINYQSYKFKYMKESLKNPQHENVKELLKEISTIRRRLGQFREDFKQQSEITIQHINDLRTIQEHVNVLTNQYIPKF